MTGDGRAGVQALAERYKHEFVSCDDERARFVATLAEQFREFVFCDDQVALKAASLVLANHDYSELVRAGFEVSRRNDPGTRRVRRELDRLTRTERPQRTALEVSGAVDLYMTQALLARGESDLYEQWRVRASLDADDAKALIRQCTPAAHDALERVDAVARGRGGPPGHGHEAFIAGAAHIFEVVFWIEPDARPGSDCRRLLEIAADHFDIQRQDLRDRSARSDLAERAIAMLQAGNLPFAGIRVVSPTSR